MSKNSYIAAWKLNQHSIVPFIIFPDAQPVVRLLWTVQQTKSSLTQQKEQKYIPHWYNAIPHQLHIKYSGINVARAILHSGLRHAFHPAIRVNPLCQNEITIAYNLAIILDLQSDLVHVYSIKSIYVEAAHCFFIKMERKYATSNNRNIRKANDIIVSEENI